MRSIATLLSATLLSACASIYVQPPAAGNAILVFDDAGAIKHRGKDLYLDGRDYSDRLRVASEDAKLLTADGKGIVIRAAKEFGATMEASRITEMALPNVTLSVCRTAVSFTPEADAKYRMRFVATYDACEIQVVRLLEVDAVVREVPDNTVQRKKMGSPFGGPACIPL